MSFAGVAIYLLIYLAVSASAILVYSLLVVRSGRVEHLLSYLFLIRGFWRFAGPIGIVAILVGGNASDPDTLAVAILFALLALVSFVGGSRFLVWLAALAAQRRYSTGAALAGQEAQTRLATAIDMWPKTFSTVCRRHATNAPDLLRVLCPKDEA